MAGAKALPAIAWAGALCGTLDITAAIVVYGRFGARPMPLLQGIAAGLLGPSAYQGWLAYRTAGSVPSLCNRFWRRNGVLPGQPQITFPNKPVVRLRNLVWHRCLLFYAKNSFASVSRHAPSILFGNDVDRSGDSHFLCRLTHCWNDPLKKLNVTVKSAF